MKNKFTLVYTIFASIIFVFSISFLAFNLYKEYSYGPARTSATFNSIISEVRTKSKTSTPEEIIGSLHKRFDKYNDFAYIKITYNDSELLRYPANASESSTSNLTKKFKSSISTDNGNFYIDCDMYLLRPYSIFYFAKISFLIILIITIVTVILIVYLNMSSEVSTSNSEVIEFDSEPELDTIQSSEEVSGKIVEVVSEEKTEPVLESNPATEAPTEVIPETTKEAEVTTPVITSDVVEQNKEPVEKVVLPSEEEKPANIENPEGLFNPITGFGWEQYLLTRLDSEINRAIASEIDISLFVIELPDLEKTSEIFKNICNYLSIQFQFKDLLFEYKDDCLAAMKISMDIDEALTFADKIYFDIKNIIQDKECYIGISSRSIRMVSGERLLHEADNALVHAKDDPDSPIIAFRVDAEKYRQFLEQQHN